MDRRSFLRRGAASLGGAVVAAGPLHALGSMVAAGDKIPAAPGYGPLVNKGDLWLPEAFDYQVISRQGEPMSDGNPTPGVFDGMAAFTSATGTGGTILIRNHENRDWKGEIPVIVPAHLSYDESTVGGNTKLEVRRDPHTGTYEVTRDFAILGGTSANCAGGVMKPHRWITCEEVVKRSANGKKHGYCFEIDARSPGPVAAVPIPQAGRFVHEAAVFAGGILYESEDRNFTSDGGACFYRYVPDRRTGTSNSLAQSSGVLEALKLRDEFRGNMDVGRTVGRPYPVQWVLVDHPDHDDDTDQQRSGPSDQLPTRFQAQTKGAAIFDRQEGMWADRGKVYFDCTTGGAANLGQVWEYDPGRQVVTLIFESSNSETLKNPDNIVTVPNTGDIFLQEDSAGDQFVRGLTRGGRIYNFAKNSTNASEFCGGCFDLDGQTLYLNQQGDRGSLPQGPPAAQAVTYAIHGPFWKRYGSRGR